MISLNVKDKNLKQEIKTNEFPFKSNDRIKRNNKIKKQNSIKDDSIILIENVDIDIELDEDNKMNKELKSSLVYLLNGFLEQYQKKAYVELIKEIEEKEELLYSDSIETFNIYILKIKSMIKLMIKEYYDAIKKKNKSIDNIVKEYLNKIMNEFKKINLIINRNNKYENEIITQIYCKFLIFIIIYESKKENREKSLAYLTLGLNMMKIYFIKDKIGIEIKTYFTYIKLIILFINNLINDNNFKFALNYVYFGFKILDIIFRFINLMKLPKKYYEKAIDYSSYIYIYCGICLEHNQINLQLSLESFIQACYFIEKSFLINDNIKYSTPSLFKNKINQLKYENNFYMVSNSTIKLLKNQIKKMKIEKENLKKKTKEEKEKEEQINQNIIDKKENLKYISNGLNINKKFVPFEEKLYKTLLTPKIQNKIKSTDKELANFVYNKNIYNENNNLSNDIKQNLCRYKIYGDFLSEKFREFIIKNEILEFNEPSKILDNINKVGKHLNNCDQFFNEEEKNIFLNFKKNKKSRNLNENRKSFKKISVFNENENPIIKKNNSYNTFNNKLRIKNSKKMLIFLGNELYKKKILKKHKIDLKKNKKNLNFYSFKNIYKSNTMKKLKTFSINKNNNITNNINDKSNKKKIHYFDELENNFERKHLDKFLTTKIYREKYSCYEKLMKNELIFQKINLALKNYNSKLYFNDFQKELTINNNDRYYSAKKKANINFLIINNKVKDEVLGNQANMQTILNEHNKEIINITKGFKLLGKSLVEDGKMKATMSKVIQKYINENKRKKKGGQNNYLETEEIKKMNEREILKFNNTIKNINYELNLKKEQINNNQI